MVNKLQGKQILASYVLAESQWITFQYGMDCHIVICQAQLVLRGVLVCSSVGTSSIYIAIDISRRFEKHLSK